MSADAKLLPCPFCDAYPIEHIKGFVFCEGNECPISMRVIPINAWNARTEYVPSEELAAAKRIIAGLMPKLYGDGLTVDSIIQGEIAAHRARGISGNET